MEITGLKNINHILKLGSGHAVWQRSASFFYKGLQSTYFQFCGPSNSVEITQLCKYDVKAATENSWVVMRGNVAFNHLRKIVLCDQGCGSLTQQMCTGQNSWFPTKALLPFLIEGAAIYSNVQIKTWTVILHFWFSFASYDSHIHTASKYYFQNMS